MAPIVTKPVDLVLAGGGVKGIGLAGAVVRLMEAGYRAHRVAGSSAGSIVGSIVAAAAKNDQLTPDNFRDLALSIDYRKFLDPGPVERVPLLGAGWAILQGTGVYRGDYAHDFIAHQLRDLGVSTFGDLRLDDDELPPEQRYRLVVTAADVTTGQLVRLPWDYHRLYGLDPDEQPVADAVRASMSIPFVFRPVTLTSVTGRESTLVDGGLLSNYPIDSLDRCDGKRPRWPTLGVTLLPDLPENNHKVIPALAPLQLFGGPSLLEDVITTILVGRDQAYLNLPWVSARTIRVDATDVGVLDFEIKKPQIDALYTEGYEAATTFLSTWDEHAYLERFRS
ncbi:phospholipase [Mycolicibacterium aromaticivorans JS19b1 = JCM 16368]|uniref:Phospholipase n=1 Tax=Mycolicibacterium aromaticivorans JS19b1 = JCM 16368 TaxID=1440774 RepID=A0A064CLY8_9MYCO|nr:patatin-like phospholipase family protein [Mycolicibacterium aromaticivorans]KDE99733.1 phospholipase [Mycolicibacterium aromaticivorans JS19b1 = JCM 16368]